MSSEWYRGYEVTPNRRTAWAARDAQGLPRLIPAEGFVVLGPGVQCLTALPDVAAARDAIDGLAHLATGGRGLSSEDLREADRLICGMIKSERTISTFVLGNVYKDLVRNGVAAFTPALDQLARQRIQKGAEGAYEGPNPYVRGLILRGAETAWVVRIRDQWEVFKDLPKSLREEGPPPAFSPPGSIDVYPTHNPPRLIERLNRGEWAPSIASMIVMTSLERRGDLSSSNGSSMDHWRDFFEIARREVAAAGLMPSVAKEAERIMSLEREEGSFKGLEDYAAAEDLVWMATRMDEGVPGLNANLLLSRMEEAFLVTSLEATSRRLRFILANEALVSGPQLMRDYNDGDDQVWIERKGEQMVMFLRNQNRSYAAVINRDSKGELVSLELTTGSHSDLRGDLPLRQKVLGSEPPVPRFRFEFPGGSPVMSVGTSVPLASIKDWNGFLGVVSSVHAGLHDDVTASKNTPVSPVSRPTM